MALESEATIEHRHKPTTILREYIGSTQEMSSDKEFLQQEDQTLSTLYAFCVHNQTHSTMTKI